MRERNISEQVVFLFFLIYLDCLLRDGVIWKNSKNDYAEQQVRTLFQFCHTTKRVLISGIERCRVDDKPENMYS